MHRFATLRCGTSMRAPRLGGGVVFCAGMNSKQESNKPPMDEALNVLAKNVTIFDSLEGRDKITKCIQFGCRAITGSLTSSTPGWKRLKSLQQSTGDARKIYRFGKFFTEVVKIKTIAGAKNDAVFDASVQAAQIASRSAFLVYWLYDGMSILSKIGIVKGEPAKAVKRGSHFWLLGLTLGIAAELKKMRNVNVQRAQALQDKDAVKTADELKKFNTTLATQKMTIAKMSGDVLVAADGSGLPALVFGRKIPEVLCGLGGFISAFLTVRDMRRK